MADKTKQGPDGLDGITKMLESKLKMMRPMMEQATDLMGRIPNFKPVEVRRTSMSFGRNHMDVPLTASITEKGMVILEFKSIAEGEAFFKSLK